MISKEELMVKIGIIRSLNGQTAAAFSSVLNEITAERSLNEGDKKVILGIIKKICQDHEESKARIDKIEEKIKGASDRVF